MSSFGYARVSTVDQDLTIQVDALEAAGCETIRSERLSGSSTKRPELNTLLEFIRQGDEFVVTRLDRFARSSRDLQNFVHDFREKGVTLRVLEKNSTPVLQQESVFSICWRHLPSLRLVSVRNVKPKALLRPKPRASTEVASHLLRPKPRASTDATRIHSLKADGLGATAIAKELGISRVSVYRALKAA